jgi:hypothetical protein
VAAKLAARSASAAQQLLLALAHEQLKVWPRPL